MILCKVCSGEFSPTISWGTVLFIETQPAICERCRNKLQRITGPLCTICGRPMPKTMTCNDCQKHQQNVLRKNRSLFTYTETTKELMNRFKFRGDAELASIFQKDFKQLFRNEFNFTNTIIPIPLSAERHYERGFNQAELLARLLDKPITDVLVKAHQEKKSKKGKTARLLENNPFFITKVGVVKSMHILLIDDIYTTGTTVRNASEILLKAGAESCSSMTLIRS
jgi:competence protein ComFC